MTTNRETRPNRIMNVIVALGFVGVLAWMMATTSRPISWLPIVGGLLVIIAARAPRYIRGSAD